MKASYEQMARDLGLAHHQRGSAGEATSRAGRGRPGARGLTGILATLTPPPQPRPEPSGRASQAERAQCHFGPGGPPERRRRPPGGRRDGQRWL